MPPRQTDLWVRDVTYQEDKSQVRARNEPRVMASLRSLECSRRITAKLQLPGTTSQNNPAEACLAPGFLRRSIARLVRTGFGHLISAATWLGGSQLSGYRPRVSQRFQHCSALKRRTVPHQPLEPSSADQQKHTHKSNLRYSAHPSALHGYSVTVTNFPVRQILTSECTQPHKMSAFRTGTDAH